MITAYGKPSHPSRPHPHPDRRPGLDAEGPLGYQPDMRRILLYDNNDSFTHNLEHLLAACTGADIVVRPYAEAGRPGQADLVVISPGPGAPGEYPLYGPLLDAGRPVLGICLGMQIINNHFGGRTGRLAGCVHGRAEHIDFLGQRVAVARYHSLAVTRLGKGLRVTARNDTGVPMALQHESLPLLGYQFHPESFLTKTGARFIEHALESLGLA